MMKTLMYTAACILALGFTSCKSDDDSFDCNAGDLILADALLQYTQNSTTATCEAYKTAIENNLANNCYLDADVIKGLRTELNVLGDCTFSGRVCLICTNSNVDEEVCRGENGNAFIGDRDLEIPFERYVELSTCI
ncbi:hypothetical protein [Aquimarina mytili]|uniref:Lipoprotein n=2 Tax=Aquimarina mytili TaxID=874423 RepID=A0A936ZZA8_9FLAO|nr:hypothetical protein [Aquimarina mytili]MBL0684728.1 hypothetical protein [Aquimarina mytili]